MEKLDTISKIIIACSGGVDSTAVVDILYKEGKKFAIAHCNFNLRGEDSKKDEDFVKELAGRYGVDFFCERFNIVDTPKKSIQMLARELRYEWFYKLLKENNFSHIATGHHLGDALESTLLNLCRGTGIRGLVNMHGDHNKKILRPLLERGFTKKKLVNYCKNHNLPWREDISNSKNDYKRNLIRNKITPLLQEINPSLEETFFNTLERFKDLENVWNKNKNRIKNLYFIEKKDFFEIKIEELKKEEGYLSILYEFLSEYGFSYHQLKDFMYNDHISGKKLVSKNCLLVKEYNNFRLSILNNNKMSKKERKIFLKDKYHSPETLVIDKKIFNIEHFRIPSICPYSDRKDVATLDLDKLEFPLYINYAEPGDKFMPLGMKTEKKLSDFFIDEKIPINERENIQIIRSEKDIVWIVNHRISEKFKIDKTTELVLELKIF